MTMTALLFPGQGSQEPGMGKDIAEHDSDVMELWKKAEKVSGIALREIYWDGDEERMPLTQYLQPALTTATISCWLKLHSKLTPDCTAGHSLGEYSALAAAGVLPIEIVIELTALRGSLMSQADPDGVGAMAAVVKLSLEQVNELVANIAEKTGEMLVVANYNTPVQLVVSGTRNSIAEISTQAKERKGRAVSLAVSGAFHSPLMKEASQELAKAINAIPKTKWNNAKFPVYSNVSAKPETDASALKDLLIRQMTSSVFWIDTIRNQWNNGVRQFVECGPKNVLTNMIGPIMKPLLPEGETANAVSVGSLAAIEQFAG